MLRDSYVIEDEVIGGDDEADCQDKQHVWNILQCAQLDEGTGFPGRETGSHICEHRQQATGVHKGENSHGPAETDLGQQLAHDQGVNQPSDRVAGGRQAQRRAPMSVKVRPYQPHGWREEDAASRPGQDRLGEEQLPVGATDAHEEHPQDHEHHPEPEGGDEQSVVERPSAEGPEEEHEERLRAADPGDGGLGVLRHEDRGVIRLEHRKRIDQAPGRHDGQPGPRDLEPCIEPAIGRRAGVRIDMEGEVGDDAAKDRRWWWVRFIVDGVTVPRCGFGG